MTGRWLVSGTVQGVGFRYFVRNRAQAIGVSGWVKNLPDGRVEVAARGSSHELGVLESALREGPPHALVANVEKVEISDETASAKSFVIM